VSTHISGAAKYAGWQSPNETGRKGAWKDAWAVIVSMAKLAVGRGDFSDG
jgi:hypothetical protein